VVKLPILVCSNGNEEAHRVKTRDRCKDFVEIVTLALDIPFCHQPSPVLDDA
jgi:hypothetical protein